MPEPREDVEALARQVAEEIKAMFDVTLDKKQVQMVMAEFNAFYEVVAARLEQTEQRNADLTRDFNAMLVACSKAERERDKYDELYEAQAKVSAQLTARAEAAERALHVAEETLGLETDEDSWISLKRRAEAAEKALRWYADQSDNYMVAQAALRGMTMDEYRAALASGEGEER